MPEKVWVGDKILTRYNNQKNAEELRFYLDTRVMVVPDWITLSAGPAWHRYWMRGNNYTHTYNNFYAYATFELSHWNFALEGMLQTNFNRFWGETLEGGENVHTLKLSYNYKDWNFGVMVLDPFYQRLQSEIGKPEPICWILSRNDLKCHQTNGRI